MIPYAWMGVLALAVLWTNTLLVAAAALQRAAWLRKNRMPRRHASLAEGVGVTHLEVASGRGPEGQLARHGVEQRGRRFAAKVPTIGWHDREYASEVFGGVLSAPGARVLVEPTSRGEVWPQRDGQIEHARLPSSEPFEAIAPAAKKAKGSLRHVEVSIGPGHGVWVAGRFRRDGDDWTVEPSDELPLIVSQLDPRAWAAGARGRLFAFAAAVVVVAAALTGLCLVPPVFGAISTVGGALALAFFLIVQPAGVWMRDQTALPSHRKIEGEWRLAAGAEA